MLPGWSTSCPIGFSSTLLTSLTTTGCSLCRDKNNIPPMLRNDFPVESVNVLKVSATLNSLQVKEIKLNLPKGPIDYRTIMGWEQDTCMWYIEISKKVVLGLNDKYEDIGGRIIWQMCFAQRGWLVGLLYSTFETIFLDSRAFSAQRTKWKWLSAWKVVQKSRRASLSRF